MGIQSYLLALACAMACGGDNKQQTDARTPCGQLRKFFAAPTTTTTQPARSGPLYCEQPVYNFGIIRYDPENTRITHEFPITNTSDKTIWVKYTRAGCGTFGNKYFKIGPRQTIKLPVNLNLGWANGRVRKAAFVKVVPPPAKSRPAHPSKRTPAGT